MAPYVPLLMPELQNVLVDPLPEVRATAAHALGSLLRGMGEQHFEGLMPWLLFTLKSEVYHHAFNIALCTRLWVALLILHKAMIHFLSVPIVKAVLP